MPYHTIGQIHHMLARPARVRYMFARRARVHHMFARRARVHHILARGARVHHMFARRARAAGGQGTVEYVGLMLLLATVLTGVVAAAGGMHGGGIAQTVVHQIEHTISSVGSASP